MRFQLQIAVAALAAVSALSGRAADSTDTLRSTSAPFSLAGGWKAQLFLEPLDREPILRGDAALRNSTLGVNMRLSRPLGRHSRLVVDATNLFDRDSQAWGGLAPPADGRGLRIQVRRSF